MAQEYGLPTRSVTEDAKQGTIAPREHRAREGGSPTPSARAGGIERGVQRLSEGLGNILTQFRDSQLEKVRADKEFEAAQRQGEQSALNSIDAARKRTGLDLKFFGQDPGVRRAQQMAVANEVLDVSLREMTNMNDRAHLSPEQYSAYLDEQYEQSMALYKGDVETQNIAKAAWMDVVKDLKEVHYKENFGYSLEEQSKQNVQRFLAKTDLIGQQLKNDPYRAAELVGELTELWNIDKAGNPGSRERADLVEALTLGLSQGNAAVMQAVQMGNFQEKATPAERAEVDQALAKYDQRKDWEYNQTVSQYQQRLEQEDFTSGEEALSAYWQAYKSIQDGHTAQGSKTERDKRNYEARLAQLRIPNVAAIDERTFNRAAALEAATQYNMYRGDDNPHGRWQDNEGGWHDLTNAQIQAGADRAMELTVANVLGIDVEDLDGQKIRDALLDPGVVAELSRNAKQFKSTPQSVQIFARDFADHWQSYADPETGIMTDNGRQRLASITGLQDTFNEVFGNNEDRDRVAIVSVGMRSNSTAQQIEEDLARFNDAKKDGVSRGAAWTETGLNKPEDRRQEIRGMLKDAGFPEYGEDADVVRKYQRVFELGYLIHGTREGAREYTKRDMAGNVYQMGNKRIYGGKFLERYIPEDVSMWQVMSSIHAEQFATLVTDLENPTLDDLEIRALPDESGVTLGSIHGSTGALVVRNEDIRSIVTEIQEREEIDRLREEAAKSEFYQRMRNAMRGVR